MIYIFKDGNVFIISDANQVNSLSGGLLTDQEVALVTSTMGVSETDSNQTSESMDVTGNVVGNEQPRDPNETPADPNAINNRHR